MNDIYLSLRSGKLRTTVITKEGFKAVTKDLSATSELLSSVSSSIEELVGTKKNKFTLNILVEPDDVISRFITINKTDGAGEEQLMAEFINKSPEFNTDDYYFSYEKIAPFIFQFVAVKKEFIESWLDISNQIGVGLRSILSWSMILPKLVSSPEAAIFMVHFDDTSYVAISEFRSTFYIDALHDNIDKPALHKIIKEISVFKRTRPIRKIYNVHYEGELSLGDEFSVHPLEIPGADIEESRDYGINMLANYLVDTEDTLLVSQNNLLNLLPVPVIVPKSNLTVYAGVTTVVALVLLAGAGIYFSRNPGGFEGFRSRLAGTDQQQMVEENVLSESTAQETQQVPEEPQQPEIDYVEDKSALRVFVQNGAGVPGIAAEGREYLTARGYTIYDIGNADSSNYENTQVKMKPTGGKLKDTLLEELRPQYTQVEYVGDLPEDTEYDVLLIIGDDLAS